MTMLRGQHREVRYAVPATVFPPEDLKDPSVYLSGRDIPIRCVRAVGSTEDLPEAQWIPAGEFPVDAFLRLYVPEDKEGC